MFGEPPHTVWQFREEQALHGSADVSASYGTDVLGGRISGGFRHSDGYREQDQRDHGHVGGKGRWQPAVNMRTGTDNVPVLTQTVGTTTLGPDYSSLAVPSVWRSGRTQAAAKVDALASNGMDEIEIPAFLRKQAD